MARALTLRKHAHWIAVGILVLGLAFYLYRIDQWFMHDDEGGYCYAAWRIAQVEMPYRDFLTPQLPLFLYWGGAVVKVFGPSILALRYATVLATLLAGWFVYLVARRAFGWGVALLSLPLFLMHKDVYFIARFFRPEAYMLLFVAAGTYVFWESYSRRHRSGMLLSGVLFGLATLCKWFAVLPAAGCGLFLLHGWFRARDRGRVSCILALSAGFAATAGAVVVAFQIVEPYFLTAVLGHHAMQGAELSTLQVALKGLQFYWSYFRGNAVFLLLALLGLFAGLRRQPETRSYFLWQVLTVAAFLVLSRDLQDRHLVYIVPSLAMLAALVPATLFGLRASSIDSAPLSEGHDNGSRTRPQALLLGVALAALALWPSWHHDLEVASWDEDDTGPLAAYIQSLTQPDDCVLSDYPGLNFHARRRNTYLGAGLSGGATSSGQITGEALIQEMEEQNVKMVLINTSGGAHQMVNLHDYAHFRRYVQSHFPLVRMFARSFQTFEIYYRDELMPLLPQAVFGGTLALTGADLGTATGEAGQEISASLRWQALSTLDHDYTVSLRLLSESGHRYGQQDAPLLRTFTARWEGPREIIEQAPTSEWGSGEVVMDDYRVFVPYGTPPGKYELTALLYNLASGEVLPAQDGSGSAPTTDYVVGTIEVTSPELPPALDVLPIQHEVMQDFGDYLQLLGHGPIVDRLRPGDSLQLALFWRALRHMDTEWQLLVRVRSQDGRVLAEKQFELANASHPTSQWVPGEVVLGQHDLTLDRSAPSGQAEISVNLVETGTGQRLLPQDRVLDVLDIEGRARQFEVPEVIQHPLIANFGNRVQLLGYDADTATINSATVLRLTLYWQALAEMDTSYTVFTHLLDTEQRICGQKDSMPLQGTYPTTAWLPAEVVVDVYEIAVQATAPEPPYTPEIGLYDAATGERVPVIDDSGQIVGDRVLLSPVGAAD